MHWKKDFRVFGIVIACVAVLSMLSAASLAGAAEYTFKIGVVTTKENPAGQGCVKLAEAAEELSNGRIHVDVFDAGQLGGELDMVSQVRMGSLDLAIIGSGIVASMEPTFSATELPFIWKTDVLAREVLDGPIGKEILSMLEPKKIKGLAWAEWGFRGILTAKKPIEKPEDLNGLKIRVIENPLYVVTMRKFGANAVPMAWPEVYTALDQGTIDGVDTNYAGMVDAKQYEVSKCLAVTDHIYTALVVMMNLKTFNSLPPDLQDVMMKAAKAGGDRTREVASALNNDSIKFMGDKGLQVTHPDREAFAKLSGDIYKKFSAQVGQDLIDKILEAQK